MTLELIALLISLLADLLFILSVFYPIKKTPIARAVV